MHFTAKSYQITDIMDIKLVGDKPVIFIANKEFRQCMFVVTQMTPEEAEKTFSVEVGINSIDELMQKPYARKFEGGGHVERLTPEDALWCHASNLLGWIHKANYDSRALASNLAFPLLKELAKNGDKKAEVALEAEIEQRLKEGNIQTMTVIFETCKDIMGPEALNIIARAPAPNLHKQLLSLKTLPVETLNILVRNRSADTSELLKQRNLTEVMLKEISLSKNVEVLEKVAKHKNSSKEILERLSKDIHISVRWNVAVNPKTSIEILKMLTNDIDQGIRYTAMKNLKSRGNTTKFATE